MRGRHAGPQATTSAEPRVKDLAVIDQETRASAPVPLVGASSHLVAVATVRTNMHQHHAPLT